jgi:hypothetical protein
LSAGRDFSRDDMTYACCLANRGYDVKMIFRALAAKPSGKRDPGSLKYQRLLDTKGRDSADRYAQRTAEKAAEFVMRNPAIRDRPSAVVRLLELQTTANALPWAVYGGPGARRALEAAFVVAERVGGPKFGLALREWAELSGQGFEVVRGRGGALGDLGWLKRNPDDRLGRTARYRLRKPPHIHSHQGGVNVGATGTRVWLNHDAFRPGGLGDDGWYLLYVIASQNCATFENLPRATGFDEDTLEDLVGRFSRYELVQANDVSALSCPDDLVPGLDDVAAELGVAGMGEADRKRHRDERDAWDAGRVRGQDVNVEVSA